MMTGHYAPAYALKSRFPETPLWQLFLGVQALDVMFFVLVPLGIERVVLDPTARMPLAMDLQFMPYSHSLVALARGAARLMTDGGSMIAMTYYGAVKVVPHYNVMGVAKASLEASVRYLAYDLGPKKIRVNAISAGPVNTLAARGIAGLLQMIKHYEEHSPLKRNLDPRELGTTGLFLASDMSTATTGQVLYVDCGYEIMGM